MDLKCHIGMRVKSARRKAGLTQEQLAEATAKAVETISNIERGHTFTGLETLETISNVLRMPLIYFFESYHPERHMKRRRAELQQRLLETSEKMSDEQIVVAVRLLEALRDKTSL
jgi:transcriptional regulator with XRE-family HTH domain